MNKELNSITDSIKAILGTKVAYHPKSYQFRENWCTVVGVTYKLVYGVEELRIVLLEEPKNNPIMTYSADPKDIYTYDELDAKYELLRHEWVECNNLVAMFPANMGAVLDELVAISNLLRKYKENVVQVQEVELVRS